MIIFPEITPTKFGEVIYEDFWLRPRDNQPMKLKVIQLRRSISRNLYFNNSMIESTKSPRPYQLGQACDGTIDHCVITAFVHFCNEFQQDPIALLKQAYPDEIHTEASLLRSIKIGLDEGVVLPKPGRWRRKAHRGLLESLGEINYHSLANLVDELIDF